MEWKSAKEIPTELKDYLCVTVEAAYGEPYYSVCIVSLCLDVFGKKYFNCENKIVTHWMELPELPERVF